MSAGVVSGRPRNRVPSDMEAMLWFRTRRIVAPDHRQGAPGAGIGRRRARSNSPTGRRTTGHQAVSAGHQASAGEVGCPVTRGDPKSPLRWTCKSRAKFAAALSNAGWKVSTTTVGRLLHELGYRLQSVRKSREGTSHPDRNTQFEHINSKADELLQRAQPVVSVDTKKKELVRDFKNAGRAVLYHVALDPIARRITIRGGHRIP